MRQQERLFDEPPMTLHEGSVFTDEQRLLKTLLQIHNGGAMVELDPMYSRGIIYGELEKPHLKYDLRKEDDAVLEGNACNLPIQSQSIKSMLLDPPFCFGIHGKTEQNISAKRFTILADYEELINLYRGIIKESNRVLKSNGILLFKCQDYTDSKTTMTHCIVWQLATNSGFYAKDLAILQNNQRIYNPNLNQKHLRKSHSYYWVFQKQHDASDAPRGEPQATGGA